ncbi:MAG: single-stranded-DNA-specific exonuclease RecJ [Pseudanabaenaceae cyanobacterium SKYGB_i_bin29]|nr:single-stranded-DNA-specific exonuclease RecJ [Pseudanabaenaceae cyanobacterium SKYG29]MDW8421915.1 single-stranded-DNA-specific exonuclease RecJ [Pseudanabaenaceae cyanobacterium SKYGB_i_bin29]
MAKAPPPQRWLIYPPDPEGAAILARELGVSPLLAQLLINRGVAEIGQEFLYPDPDRLPHPVTEFQRLAETVPPEARSVVAGSFAYSLERLRHAIGKGEKIAICGDYDVDGMTSTALLLRTLRELGGIAEYAIPSRMQEGYGINERIVREFAARGVGVIITVDNGIAAQQPIELARELGMTVIVTDHHDIPPTLPPASALLNPKFLHPSSPYRSMAGVGVAYLLGLELATMLGKREKLQNSLLELFTLGTIADVAELTGVNRPLVKKGLQLLPQSQIVGVQALMAKAGINPQQALRPEAIGFQLGPRINAVGRIGDPQVVIDLLTTEDWWEAEAKATICEEQNQKRQQLCEQIEQEAVAHIEQQIASGAWNLQADKVIVIVDREISPETHWHHGVIGIVASRLVERYGAPVFIGSVEREKQEVRFSVRSIPEFHVSQSLEFIADIRGKGGGHKVAGGFSLPLAHLPILKNRLTEFAHQTGVLPEHIQPFVQVDSMIHLTDLSLSHLTEMELLQPCGVGNPDPLFCTRAVKVVQQSTFGKEDNHLKLILDRGDGRKITAVAWRWQEYHPVAEEVDIVFSAKVKSYGEEQAIELELKGLRNFRLTYKQPPRLTGQYQWQDVRDFQKKVPSLLVYGYNRPQNKFEPWTEQIFYDRPQGKCTAILFWTLPPSLDHLRWLVWVAQPQYIYLAGHVPPLPGLGELRQKIADHLPDWDLLVTSQKWWVSPRAIVAGLRELGYRCPDFPPTQTLAAELQQLANWYKLSPAELSRQFTSP